MVACARGLIACKREKTSVFLKTGLLVVCRTDLVLHWKKRSSDEVMQMALALLVLNYVQEISPNNAIYQLDGVGIFSAFFFFFPPLTNMRISIGFFILFYFFNLQRRKHLWVTLKLFITLVKNDHLEFLLTSAWN